MWKDWGAHIKVYVRDHIVFSFVPVLIDGPHPISTASNVTAQVTKVWFGLVTKHIRTVHRPSSQRGMSMIGSPVQRGGKGLEQLGNFSTQNSKFSKWCIPRQKILNNIISTFLFTESFFNAQHTYNPINPVQNVESLKCKVRVENTYEEVTNHIVIISFPCFSLPISILILLPNDPIHSLW